MKKYGLIVIGLIILIIGLFLINNHSNSKDELKSIKCEVISDQSISGYINTTKYEIFYDGDLVDYINQTDIIDSEDENILNFFNTQLVNQYKSYNDLYGGYTYNVKEENNKLIIETKIDYKIIDLSKFVNDNPSMKEYLNSDNKLTTDSVVKMYKNIGAHCK